jgi:hypothetical protein
MSRKLASSTTAIDMEAGELVSKRPRVHIDTSSESTVDEYDRSRRAELLRELLEKWMTPLPYNELISVLLPIAQTNVSSGRSTPGMVVSLDDQLEWQETLRSHSPRTPSAPEVIRNLKKHSPPPTEGVRPDMEPDVSVDDFLPLMSRPGYLASGRLFGDSIHFEDFTAIPASMALPVNVRFLDYDKDDRVERSGNLTVGAAWLSVAGDYSYDSQLASIVRARKSIPEVHADDRKRINSFCEGNLSTEDFLAGKEGDSGLAGRLRKIGQMKNLQENKKISEDQLGRLRRLLARELSKPTAKPSPPPPQPVTPSPVAEPPLVAVPFPAETLREMKIELMRIDREISENFEIKNKLNRRLKRLRYVRYHPTPSLLGRVCTIRPP